MKDDNKDWVDAQGYADMLGLDSAEQLKRLARKGVLASRIPDVKQWRWYKKDVENRIKQKQREGDVFRKIATGIARNLRRCSSDSVIYAIWNTVGSKVYGQEYVLATGEAGRVEYIMLVKVNKSAALKMLEQLPKKDFPELKGISDWADLTYDRITEDLIVKLETYF